MARTFPNAVLMLAVLAVAHPATAAPRTFGVGDVVYAREIKEPLPNAFGGNDIFGRKRTIGRIELRYLGREGSAAVFARRDTRIETDETTMNRSGAVVGSVGGKTVVLQGVGQRASIRALAPDEFRLSVDMGGDTSIIIDGSELKVVDATESRVVVDVPPSQRR